MSASLVRLADAVTDAVNGGTFSVPFVAVREWLPVYQLAGGLTALRVNVAPMTRESARVARSKDQHDHAVEIAFQKELASETTINTDVDAIVALVEEVADYLARRTMSADGTVWHVMGVKIDPVCAFAELEGLRLFTSVIEATYREFRDATQ